MSRWWENPIPVPTKFKYKARHIPTNRSWIREKEYYNRAAFLKELARWNRMHPDWVYTEVQ